MVVGHVATSDCAPPVDVCLSVISADVDAVVGCRLNSKMAQRDSKMYHCSIAICT